MAPDRSVGSPRRPDQAHRLPRDHQTGDPRGYRETAHGQHGPGERPAGAPHTRPTGRFRTVARTVEEGSPVVIGRPRAVGSRTPDRGTRTRDHRLPLDSLFPRRSTILRRRRPRKNALQSRALVAFRNRSAGGSIPEKLYRCNVYGGQGATPRLRSRPRRSSRRQAANWACPFRRRCPWHSTSTNKVSLPTCVPTQ